MNNYIIDSHTLLWYFGGNSELSDQAKYLIVDSSNNIYVSMATLWEIAIKHSLGKLDLPRPFADLERSIQAEGFMILPIETGDIAGIISLPFHHRDPFDRMIIAQSLRSGYPVIGKDEFFDMYGVKRLWLDKK